MDVLTSAEIRVLRKLARFGSLPLHCDLEPILKGLESYAEISYSDSDKEGNAVPAFWVITRDGGRYLQFLSNLRREFWKNFFSQFMSGLVVGVVSTLLATWLTGLLHLDHDQCIQPNAFPTITVSAQPTLTPKPSPTPFSNTLFHSDIGSTPS